MIEVKNIKSEQEQIQKGLQKLRYQEDDGIPLCPVFHPTEEEFSDFSGFLEKCVSQIGTIGIFKVIPPASYVARKSGYKNIKFNVKKPMEQNVQSTRTKGTYELILIDQVSRSLERFQSEAQKNGEITHGKSVEQIEKLFWKSLKNSSPIYGADVAGSLFDKGVRWNLSEVSNILKDGLGDQKIPGVTNPYVYVGSWKTMFGWHKEDMDLYSINYVHHGKSKFWYGVDLRDNTKFENFMNKAFPEAQKKCGEFVRHKTTLVQPKVLIENGIRVVKNVHNENEFMISRAAAYHSGFNFGFNIAEAVNFALKDWLTIGPNVNYCKCIDFSVSIDMKNFYLTLGLNPKDYMEVISDDESEETIPSSEKLTPVSATPSPEVVKKAVKSKLKLKLPQKIFQTERIYRNIQSVIDTSDWINRIEVSKSILPKTFNSQPVPYTNKLLDKPKPTLGKRIKPVLQKSVRSQKRQKVTEKKANIIEIDKSKLTERFDVKTRKIETWYSSTNKNCMNIYELIQICDQLSVHLKKDSKFVLNKRLDKMKYLFYEKNRNNSKSRITSGCFNEYSSPNDFQNDVISLYQDMHDSINSNNFVECIVVGETEEKIDDQDVQCSNCSRIMTLSINTIKLIKNYKRESIIMQKKLLMRYLKSLKSVPQELKLDENKEANIQLNCYDIACKRQSDCQKQIVQEEVRKREKIDKLLNTHYKKEETRIVSHHKYKSFDKKIDYDIVQKQLKIIFADRAPALKNKK